MGRLAGKVALISGGNSGIGQATAALFAAEGAQVMIAARDMTKAEATLERIVKASGEADVIKCDVRQAELCQRAVDATLTRFGRLDIVFNNAGIVPMGSVLETSLDVWQDVLATNVSGTFFLSKAALPVMIEQGSGVIVNNCSDWGVVGGHHAAAYSTSKGAVALLTKSMALDHARQGIRVNAICPGDTYVERWDSRRHAEQSKAEWMDSLGRGFPMGRVGSVEEIAKAVLFLASDESSYMTGQLLVVDGGNTAGGTSVQY